MVDVTENGSPAAATPPHRPLYIPPLWTEAAESIASSGPVNAPPVAVVCGPKNSGKSTFSRHLVNTLLQRYKKVGYLDTDVGQPEFTVPGCLALHLIHEQIEDLSSPSIKSPERCFFFGDLSSKRDPKAYLNCIYRLYDYFVKEHYQPDELGYPGEKMLPLVINTPGWVKGIGYDLLVAMLRYVSPSHVIQLRISADSKNLPNGAFWLQGEEGSFQLIDIHPARKDCLNRSVLTRKDARGMRDDRLFQYFRQCLPSCLNITTNKELCCALASLPPYEAAFSKLKIMHLHCEVPSGEIFHSLNATIVGLAISSKGLEKSHCSAPWCVGLGIVRGVDIEKGLCFVITPVPFCTLQKVDHLLQGFIEMPSGLLQYHVCAFYNSDFLASHLFIERLIGSSIRIILSDTCSIVL